MAKHNRIYSPEQVAFLEENVKGRSVDELRQMFNAHFGVNYGYESVRAALKNRGLSSGYNARFEKGHVPANKGVKGIHLSPATEFKKGQMPVNYRPVGSERVNVDGYIEIKVKDPRTWKLKHAVVWENAHGPVPKGHAVTFADGNRLNVSLDNLLLISRSQLAVLNKRGLLQKDAALNETALLTADLILKIGALKKRSKSRKEKNTI